MENIFSLKEACERNISKIRGINWPEGNFIELSFIGKTPFPRCKHHVNGNIFALPVSGINEDVKSFTFADDCSSYDEYFDKNAYSELEERIKELKKRKA